MNKKLILICICGLALRAPVCKPWRRTSPISRPHRLPARRPIPSQAQIPAKRMFLMPTLPPWSTPGCNSSPLNWA
jgi:hypothetical protein